MDFQSLLDKAAHNAKRVTKTIEELESEKELKRRNELQRITLEKKEKLALAMKKRAQMPKRELTPEKKFVIPKKKAAESSIDRDKVLNFLAKKEEEKKAFDKQKQAEKEKLIQLRMQGNGGKANKKLGKHFGLNVIDLQKRYGNDHTHVERLQKQQWREEEEIDYLSSQMRGGVYKAIQEKNKKVQHVDIKHREPHRMATSKSNSLAGLSSRHAATRDHFSPPKETKKDVTKSTSSLEKKKRPAAAPVDFSTLMKVAADKSAGKKVDLAVLAPPPPKIPRLNNDRPMSSRDIRPTSSKDARPSSDFRSTSRSSTALQKPLSGGLSSSVARNHSTNTSKSSSSKLPSKNMSVNSSHSVKRPDSNTKSSAKNGETEWQPAETDKSKKDPKGRFVKAPTPPPAIPQAVLGKKYLPGDVRYKQQQQMLKAAGLPTSSSSVQKRPDIKTLSGNSSNRPIDRERSGYRPMDSSSSKTSRVSSGVSREKAMELERRRRQMEKKRYEKERYERMSLVEREREREKQNYREMYDNEEEDDDEYDSDMDDFIDDSGMDMDDFSRMDFEETLRAVNPKYNKETWKERERMISDRDMEANYRTIAAEEARSARLGFLEDVYEAKKNKSEAL